MSKTKETYGPMFNALSIVRLVRHGDGLERLADGAPNPNRGMSFLGSASDLVRRFGEKSIASVGITPESSHAECVQMYIVYQ